VSAVQVNIEIVRAFVRLRALLATHRGQRFGKAVERTLVRIAESPFLFPLLYEPDIRSAKVDRFSYRVVYIIVGGDIDVIAVAHAAGRDVK